MIGPQSTFFKRWQLSASEKHRLTTALGTCPCINDDHTRYAVIQQLPENIRRARNTKALRQDVDIQTIVDACLNYPEGMYRLIDIIHRHDEGTWQIHDLYTTLQHIRPQPIPWAEVAKLKRTLVKAPILTETVQQCIQRISAPVLLPTIRDTDDLLHQTLDYLAQYGTSSDGTVPILLFLHQLATSIIDSSIEKEINAWIDDIAIHLGIDSAQNTYTNNYTTFSSEDNELDADYLLITVQPDLWEEDPPLFLIKGWLFHEKGRESLSIDEGKQTLAAIPQIFEHLIIESLHRLYRLKRMNVPLNIEVFLPYSMLGYDIDQIKIKVGKSMLKVPIGTRYQIVVRSYDRVYDYEMRSTWDLWFAKWRSYKNKNHHGSSIFFCEEGDCNQQNVFFHKLQDCNIVCLALTLIPPKVLASNEWNILLTMLDAGTPISIWYREHINAGEQIYPDLDDTVQNKSLGDLRQLVTSTRIIAAIQKDILHVGNHITLLWDDPERLPPDVESIFQPPDM